MKYFNILLFLTCLLVLYFTPKKTQVLKMDAMVFQINEERTGIDSIYFDRN